MTIGYERFCFIPTCGDNDNNGQPAKKKKERKAVWATNALTRPAPSLNHQPATLPSETHLPPIHRRDRKWYPRSCVCMRACVCVLYVRAFTMFRSGIRSPRPVPPEQNNEKANDVWYDSGRPHTAVHDLPCDHQGIGSSCSQPTKPSSPKKQTGTACIKRPSLEKEGNAWCLCSLPCPSRRRGEHTKRPKLDD
jgi:hypothetical protein